MVNNNFKHTDPDDFHGKELTLHDCISDKISFKDNILRFYLLLPQFCSVWLLLGNKKVPFVYRTKGTFLSDAFLAERDAHSVRDAGFACDARLRRVSGTHRITYHSAAASLTSYRRKAMHH